ncbi:MAG: pilus assembly protein PilM [Patescibacteria group bacterium]
MRTDAYDSFGIDISDASIRVVRLGAHNAVTSYGEGVLPRGVVRHGRIADASAFCRALRELSGSAHGAPVAKSAWAFVGIPDEHVLIRQFDYESGAHGRKLRKLILTDFEKEFPAMEEEKYLSWETIEPQPEHEPVVVLAALSSKKAIDEYVAAFHACDVRIAGMQATSIAVASALVPGGLAGGARSKRSVMDGTVFVDLRADHATLTFFDLGSVQFVLAVDTPRSSMEALTVRIRERIALGSDWYERRKGGKFRKVATVGDPEAAAALARYLGKDGWFEASEGNHLVNIDAVGSVAKLPCAYAAAVGLALRTEL